MEKPRTFFYVRVSDEIKRRFDELCDSRDENTAAAIRRLIRDELARVGKQKQDRPRKGK
jgi:predicted transcriptional regulator